MIRWAQQTEEAYPDLSSLKRELERAQREKDIANLDRDNAKLERDQANLERDQAILERDQAWRDLNMIMAAYQHEQRVRENCEQLKSEMEKLQRRQQVTSGDIIPSGSRRRVSQHMRKRIQHMRR